MTRRTRLVLLLVAAVLLTLLVYGIITASSPHLLKKRIDKEIAREQYQIALDLSIKLMEQYPSTKQARESSYIIIRKYLDNSIREITIGSGFSYSNFSGIDEGFVIKDEDRGNLFELMALVAENQVNSIWTQHLYRELGLIAANLKKYILAEGYYQLAFDGYLAGGHEYWTNEMAIIQMKYFREKGEFDTARKFLEYLLAHVDDGLMQEAEVHAWYGVFLVEDGQFSKGADEFIKAKELVTKKLSIDQGVEDGAVAYSEYQPAYIMAEQGLSHIEMIEKTGVSEAADSGAVITLLRNGQPVQGIKGQLLLEPEEEYPSYSSHLFDSLALNAEVSNSSGQLVFNSLPAGKYDLIFYFDEQDLQGIGSFEIPEAIYVEAGSMQNYQIEMRDKVTITYPVGSLEAAYGTTFSVAWDEYPDADSYRIDYVFFLDTKDSLGSTSIGSTFGYTTETSYTIDFSSKEYKNLTSNNSGSEIYPSSVMGLFYFESQFTVKVIALDSDGHTLSDSYGLVYDQNSNYPLWIIDYPEDKSLLYQGDYLVLENKYDKAMEAYLAEAEKGDSQAQLRAYRLEGALKYLEYFK